jgi:hypothetical protein
MSGVEDNYRDFGHCPMCSGDTHVVGLRTVDVGQDENIIDVPTSKQIKLVGCNQCRSIWEEVVE